VQQLHALQPADGVGQRIDTLAITPSADENHRARRGRRRPHAPRELIEIDAVGIDEQLGQQRWVAFSEALDDMT
jgi:hypothetical protein